MQFLFMALFAAIIVVLDQLVKHWVIAAIPLYSRMEMIPGLFHLTHVQNTGAAFSAFRGMQWLFALIFLLFTAVIIFEYFFKRQPFTTLERWCIAAIYGGGVGNMIDRIRWGYVVDMIEVEFIEFPVFNIADSFITCGCILLLVHMIFFNKQFWKEEKK